MILLKLLNDLCVFINEIFPVSALQIDDKEFNIIKTEKVENPNPPPESEEESDSERRPRKRKAGMNGGPDSKYSRHDETNDGYYDDNGSYYNMKQEGMDAQYANGGQYQDPNMSQMGIPPAPMGTGDLNEVSTVCCLYLKKIVLHCVFRNVLLRLFTY